MKKFLMLVVVLAFATLASTAQNYNELIKANPAMAGANMMNYHFQIQDYTPAPKGYEPFYISHYGRHGSRYDSNDVNAEKVWPIMIKAEESGLLTEAGRAFWKDLKAVLEEQDEMYGMLTSLGAREHRGIAERMVRNFPEIFKRRTERSDVHCQSSTSPRCIVSMTNFTHSLERNTGRMNFSYVTGDRYMNHLAYRPKDEKAKKMAATKEIDVRRDIMKPMEIIEYFFNDTAKALEIIGDPFIFEQRLYLASCVGHLSDYGVCLLAHFPHDILVRNFEVRNPRFYLSYGISDEMGEYQKQVSRKLLADFIERADDAIQDGSSTAADLRFGHDTSLLPLVGHIRIEGMDNWAAFDQVNSVWNASASICMASNLQMIFYKNRKGEVLVKMMYNEKETVIPALKTSDGPYYRWDELRGYFMSLL